MKRRGALHSGGQDARTYRCWTEADSNRSSGFFFARAVIAFLASWNWSAAALAETPLLNQPAQVFARATSSVLLAVARVDGTRLAAAGERGIILLSDDGGKSWRQAVVPVSVSITNLCFVSSSAGWAVGHGGVVLHSADGGQTWTKQLDGARAAAIELKAAQDDALAGTEAGRRRLAEATRLADEGSDKPLFDVFFRDDRHGLVVGAYGMILATSDGGSTWQSLKRNIDNPKGKHLYSISAGKDGVYVAGEQGALFRSDDWSRFTEIPTPYSGSYFGVLSTPAGSVLVFGLRGNAYRSSDRGATWSRIDTSPAVSLTAAAHTAEGAVVAVDESGRVLLSNDDARTFQPVPVSRPYPFTGVTQAADGSLILSGARGVQKIALSSLHSKEKRQ